MSDEIFVRDSKRDPLNVIKISKNAGRIIKRSAIPDLLCWITVNFMDLLKILDEMFNFYDNTLIILKYLTSILLYFGTIGIIATVEFLRAYHETERNLNTQRDISKLSSQNLYDPSMPSSQNLFGSTNHSDLISFNVGGRVFATKKSYLLKYKHSYFTKVLKNSKSIVFIDRDSFYFEHVLNYARGNLSYLQITDSNSLRLLLNDAKYYKLDDMISDLKVAIQHRYSFENCQFENIQTHQTSSLFSFSRKNDDIIRISVRGLVFETRRRTMSSFKESLLSDIFQDNSITEIFIDRDSTNFRHVINFYRGVNSTMDITCASQLRFLLKEVRFYRLLEMEKMIKQQIDIQNTKLDEDDKMHNVQTLNVMSTKFLQVVLPRSLYSLLPYSLQNQPQKNCLVMITVGNELFCATASTLSAYDEFAKSLHETTEYTSEGIPKLNIDRQCTYFRYILDYIDGEDITENLNDIGILNGISDEAHFFKLWELIYKLNMKREMLNNPKPNWLEIIVIGITALLI